MLHEGIKKIDQKSEDSIFIFSQKIHTEKLFYNDSTYFSDFGDGFFAVFNPEDEQKKINITVSDTESTIYKEIEIIAVPNQFQCFAVNKNFKPSKQNIFIFRSSKDSITILDSYTKKFYSTATVFFPCLTKDLKSTLDRSKYGFQTGGTAKQDDLLLSIFSMNHSNTITVDIFLKYNYEIKEEF